MMSSQGLLEEFLDRPDSSRLSQALSTIYLGILEKADHNYSGFVPDVLGATGIAASREETLGVLAQGLALALLDLEERGLPIPNPTPFSDLDLSEHQPAEPYEVVEVRAAPINPISLKLEKALDDAELSQAEAARRMGVPRSVVNRLTDPFYFGHSVRSIRRFARALNLDLQLDLVPAST